MEDQANSVGNEFVSVAWLEDAIEYAHAHGQMKALTCLETIKEDAVFVAEMAATGRGYTVG